MTGGLRRFQQSGQSHFLTSSCFHRKANFNSPDAYDLFVQCLEEMGLRPAGNWDRRNRVGMDHHGSGSKNRIRPRESVP